MLRVWFTTIQQILLPLLLIFFDISMWWFLLFCDFLNPVNWRLNRIVLLFVLLLPVFALFFLTHVFYYGESARLLVHKHVGVPPNLILSKRRTRTMFLRIIGISAESMESTLLYFIIITVKLVCKFGDLSQRLSIYLPLSSLRQSRIRLVLNKFTRL